MKKNIYAIYGASGFGKEVLPLLRQQLNQDQDLYFVDDNKTLEILNGYKVLSLDDFLGIDADSYYITIAIANSEIREKLTNKCLENGINILINIVYLLKSLIVLARKDIISCME